MIIGVTKDNGVYAAAETDPDDLFKLFRVLFPEQFSPPVPEPIIKKHYVGEILVNSAGQKLEVEAILPDGVCITKVIK